MSDEKENGSTVVSFADKVKSIAVPTPNAPATEIDEQESIETALEIGLETFQDIIEQDAKGFIAISFNKSGEPFVIHAGEIDLIRTIGTLEFIKSEFLSSVYNGTSAELLDEDTPID